jgi:uncharacterized cysteine cluster protein YcgN (CxxCxxCC family)
LNARPRFWEKAALEDFSESEWEAVCDGCGKCCLHKLEDDATQEVHYTSVACRLLDLENCRCRDYDNRQLQVPDCLKLKAAQIGEFRWLPQTCAYRLLAEGRSLPLWHPLISGRRDSVHDAGVSVKSWAISELEIGVGEDLADYALDGDL